MPFLSDLNCCSSCLCFLFATHCSLNLILMAINGCWRMAAIYIHCFPTNYWQFMNIWSQMRNGFLYYYFFFFSGVVIEIIMFCLIALCTKLLIESGMGGNSYLGFMYMVNELCYSKLLFDVEIQYIILESNSSVTQRWGSTECKSW